MHRSSATSLGYVMVAVFVLLSYVAVLGLYEEFLNHVLPRGDPFTYTIRLFQLIDHGRAHYLATIGAVFRGEYAWYRLTELSTALLSPILTRDPAVLCIINYLIWGLATVAFFRLGLAMQLGVGRAFVVALIPWVWPVNYGFMDYTSIPVLALDASFTGALLLALASSFVFALNPHRTVNGIIAAVSIGVAIWGRGNSAPVVALVVGWPCLLALWNARQVGGRRVWFNVVLAAIVALAMTIEFYVTNRGPIAEYYLSVHAAFATRHHWNLHDALPYLKNIPGFMYWRSENSWTTISLSWASHFVPILALLAAWPGRALAAARRKACRQLAIAGALIYYGTYAADLALWTDPVITLDNALLIWRPMLIGLSVSGTVLFVRVTDPLWIKKDLWVLLPASAAMLIWGMVWSAHYTPWEWAVGVPSPTTVERFALGAEAILGDPGPFSVIWFGVWNDGILDYYRAKDGSPELPLYMGRYYNDMWSQSDYSEANRTRVLEEVKEQFLKASVIIIGEYLNDYAPVHPYAFYHFKQDWANWLNSPEAPRLRVRLILQESPRLRLLVLQREELAQGRGDPFRLPWGNRPPTFTPDYSDAVIRFH